MLIEIAYECFGEKHSKIDASNIKIPDSGNLKGIPVNDDKNTPITIKILQVF